MGDTTNKLIKLLASPIILKHRKKVLEIAAGFMNVSIESLDSIS